MLRIRLDVNGQDIGELAVWNRGEQNDDGQIRYSVYDLRDIETDVLSEADPLCDVYHHRAYGAASLTAAVMEAVGEQPLDHAYDSR